MTRQEIIDFCLTFPEAYEDYPFDDIVNENACTVMRHRRNKKSFALIMRHGSDWYLNLKCDPMEADFLRSIYRSIIPGYHMNKTHWNTVILGGGSPCGSDVPKEELRRMIERSYELIKPKLKQNRRSCHE